MRTMRISLRIMNLYTVFLRKLDPHFHVLNNIQIQMLHVNQLRLIFTDAAFAASWAGRNLGYCISVSRRHSVNSWWVRHIPLWAAYHKEALDERDCRKRSYKNKVLHPHHILRAYLYLWEMKSRVHKRKNLKFQENITEVHTIKFAITEIGAKGIRPNLFANNCARKPRLYPEGMLKRIG